MGDNLPQRPVAGDVDVDSCRERGKDGGGSWHLGYLESQFLAAGIRVVSADRPGYGRSTPKPGRSMIDWPSDVAALADALGIDRFMVAGHSSGGPYAVACAAQLPERVVAGIVLGGVTDMGWPEAWEGYIDSEIQLMCLRDEAAAIAWCQDRCWPDMGT